MGAILLLRVQAILGLALLVGVARAQTGATSGSPEDRVATAMEALRSYDRSTRIDAARKLRDRAILHEGGAFRGRTDGICAALRKDGEDPKVLSFLLEALERIEGPVCADVLPALVRHPNAEIRGGVSPLVARSLDAKSAERHLVPLLGDPVAGVRAAAARSFGGLRGVPVKDRLLPLLRDTDEAVRKAAVVGLVTAREPGTIGALVDVLSDPKTPARTLVRLGLAELTGKDFGDDAAAWKAGLASDAAPKPVAGTPQSPELQKLAQQARIQLESTRAADRIAGLRQVQLSIQRFGPATTLDAFLPAIERTLKDADTEVRREALALLQSLHDPRLIDPLLRVLREDPPMRAQALLALPDVDDPRLRELLVTLLADESQTTVNMALERLAKRPDPSLIPAVIAAARRATHLHVTESATALLTAIGRPAVPPLIEACARENASVRRIALGALANLGDERALDVMLAGLEDADFFVKQNACEGLKRLDSGGLHAAIVARLDHARPQVRALAMEIVGAQRSPNAFESLVAGLQDPNAQVQTSAVKGLADLRDPRSAEPLIQAIGAPRFSPRADAAKALAQLADRATIERIAAALPRASADGRPFLVMALREMGAPAQGALMALLDADVAWKFEIAQALSYQVDPTYRGTKDPRVVDRLVKYAAEDRTFTAADENERVFFLQRLQDPRAVRAMLAMTRATQGKVPQTLTLALGKPDSPMVAEVLIAALRDPDVTLRRAAAYVLGYAKPRAAVEPLLTAFDDADATVRAWAVWSVGQSFEYLRSTLDARALTLHIVRVLEKRTEAVDVRVKAAEALARIRDDARLPALVTVLTDAREPLPLRVQAARALQGTSYGPANEALQRVKSSPTEPQELREACMTPKEVLELHSGKR